MKNHYNYSLRLILAFTDYVIINYVFILSFQLVNASNQFVAYDLYRRNLITINLLWFICSNIINFYSVQRPTREFNQYGFTWKVWSLHVLFLTSCLFYTRELMALKYVLICFYVMLAVHFLIRKFLLSIIESFIKRKFKFRKQVALMGISPSAIALASYFKDNENLYSFEGFLNESESLNNGSKDEFLKDVRLQMKKAADNGINELYVSLTPVLSDNIEFLLNQAESHCIRLKFVPDFSPSITAQYSINYIGNSPVISLKTEPLEELHNRFAKRLVDILFSLFVLVFIMSWLYPIIGIIIKCQGKGPVLFKQLRNGRNNTEFWCYKFRSMRVNDESHTRQVSKNDERITRVGKFLRKTSLDELPQFINVLLGDMSVIGPRPHMLKHTEHYRSIIDKYMVRHYLKPGITGWAQINGFRGETNDISLMEKRVEYDIWYLENWTPSLDLKIIYFTILNALRGEENAY
ncbi:undecaprenyl-phosphate glucose phosphotransferase [Mucilaginibacter sp. SP1R1]|uniref:undecaprenyl-phosphate glucose phosphotransferase n=1 Tax=Mucilaginibacter sp. SP1R1 TaxID=2723091 RepID=UPI0016072DEB|nr:undecaprenyl-phosphate glucose phosphotransferase [Mucilaginibacter sp. SP1R1]MBB6149053.1 putative colanic acid biosynthesis UDP-glucose lipid carrier transferase [Mucilaginibacter sp. SP1R1]